MADTAKYPVQAPISDYGNGGFRFAGISHQGSLLLLPGGIYAWNVVEFSQLKSNDFQLVFDQNEKIDFLLLGCGSHLLNPDTHIRKAFDAHDIGLEFMSTGAAVRTYNILLAEKRNIGAAVIAVENP